MDIRFTAPPLHQFKLIASALSQNERKKTEENDKKNRKQSILLSRGIKKSKNDKENSDETIDRENEKLSGSEFRPATDFWSGKFQFLRATNRSEKEKQVLDQMNLQKSKNIEYRNSETKSAVMDQSKTNGRENQRYEQQAKLLSPRKGTKPISSIHGIESENDDFDLLMNLKSGYRDMLTAKPTIWSNTGQFISGMNKRMERGNQRQTEYLSLNPDCSMGTSINNQPWNPLNTIAQSGKIWTPEYQLLKVMNQSPALTSQHQRNYQQDPEGWDKVSIFQGPIGQFVTPITPVNGILDNSAHMSPFTLNRPWMSNRATAINRSWRTLNDIIPAHPVYTEYAESFQPTLGAIPLLTVTSVSQTSPSFNDFRFYNRLLSLPTMITMKPNYQKIGTETGDYGNKQQQKDPRIHFEKRYIINLKLKIKSLFSQYSRISKCYIIFKSKYKYYWQINNRN